MIVFLSKHKNACQIKSFKLLLTKKLETIIFKNIFEAAYEEFLTHFMPSQ